MIRHQGRWTRASAVVCAGICGVGWVLASSVGASGATTASESVPPPTSVFGASTDWPWFGNNPWQDRFAPLPAVSPANGARLRLAFRIPLPGAVGSNESFPLEVNGVLYATASGSQVYAVDAGTGQRLWTWPGPANAGAAPAHINRGVAVANQRVYVLTADDQLIALDRKTGRAVYAVSVADPAQGYFESMAPLVADGRVIVGSSGGDLGVRGFVAAFDATSGRRLWQFYTVPRRGQGWMAATGAHGGGAVWTTPTYDPRRGQLYVDTGNPSPDYYGKTRPGPDPYTDSVLNLRLQTGVLNWFRQEVPHDLWDYDVASPPLLFPYTGGLAVGEAGKDGFWYEWDAKTGRVLTPPLAFVRQQHSPPTATGTMEWPGPAGGANYGPSAYDPLTGDAYVAGINGPERLSAGPAPHSGYGLDLGTGQSVAPRKDWTGTITAIDVGNGRMAWQVRTPTPPIGGVTVTAGGIVFFGLADGHLEGLSARNGRIVWQRDAGAPIGSAPILYRWRGADYLVYVTGGAASLTSLFPWRGQDELIAFRLST